MATTPKEDNSTTPTTPPPITPQPPLHHDDANTHHNSPHRNMIVGWMLGIVGALLLGMIVGIVIGINLPNSKRALDRTQKTSQQNRTTTPKDMSRRGTFGVVTTVSADAITIRELNGDASHTFSIASTTTVTNTGASAKASDIKVGDTVRIVTDTQVQSSASPKATKIVINPAMPRMQTGTDSMMRGQDTAR